MVSHDGSSGSLVSLTGPSDLFRPDVPESPLACNNQYQFCNADKDHCGPLASHIDTVKGAAPMFGTTTEATDMFNITNMFNSTNMTKPMAGRFQRLTNTLQQYPIQFVSTHDLHLESLLTWQNRRSMTAWGAPPGRPVAARGDSAVGDHAGWLASILCRSGERPTLSRA